MNLTDLIVAVTPLALMGVGGFLFFFGWILGGPRSRPFYTVVVVAALAAFLSQISLGIGYSRAGGLRTPQALLYTWSPVGDTGFGVTLGFRADLLAYLFALPLTALALISTLYSLTRRPSAEVGSGIAPGRLYGLIFLAEGAGLAAFYATDFVMMYFWLEGVGLALYLLSGPGLRGASAKPSSYRAWEISFFAGLAIFVPLLVIISRGGGQSTYTDLIPAVLDTTLFGLILAGCLAKTAQFPFQIWLGSFDDLPGAAYATLAGGFIFPFAVYLPVRLQSLVGDQLDLFGGLSWLLVGGGALTVFFAAITALRGTKGNLTATVGLLAAAQFGFVLIALGLNDLPAAFEQLISLVIGAPLLFLCADQLQIELAPPPNPDNRANPKPLGRPALFRSILVGCYLVGAWNFLGLPLSPAYTGRWQTLADLLANGSRFWAGLAIIGMLLLVPALLRGLLFLLNGPRRTADAVGQEWFWVLVGPLLLAVVSIGLGFQPNLAGTWVGQAVSRVQTETVVIGAAQVGWLGLLVAFGLVLGSAYYWLSQRGIAVAPFNGGLSFEPEDDQQPHYARTGRSKMALKLIEPEEEIPEGFEDDFFSAAFGRKPKSATATRRILPDPRLSSADYFAPLQNAGRGIFTWLDTSWLGGLAATFLTRLSDIIRRIFEWIVERFYPALAAFVLLIFIILLTR